MNQALGYLCSHLGIPKRVFEGASDEILPASANTLGKERTSILGGEISKKIILPVLEKQCPELFWTPIFLCSPRGRMYIRREPPTITLE